MAGVRKSATGEDLQRVAEIEEGLKTRMEGNEDQTGEGASKGCRGTGRGCASLAQGADERQKVNGTYCKGKGKGKGGKEEHESTERVGGKGIQQCTKIRRVKKSSRKMRRMTGSRHGAGGSHPQATSDVDEEEQGKREEPEEGGEEKRRCRRKGSRTGAHKVELKSSDEERSELTANVERSTREGSKEREVGELTRGESREERRE